MKKFLMVIGLMAFAGFASCASASEQYLTSAELKALETADATFEGEYAEGYSFADTKGRVEPEDMYLSDFTES